VCRAGADFLTHAVAIAVSPPTLLQPICSDAIYPSRSCCGHPSPQNLAAETAWLDRHAAALPSRSPRNYPPARLDTATNG
jgi:hypothetical protein